LRVTLRVTRLISQRRSLERQRPTKQRAYEKKSRRLALGASNTEKRKDVRRHYDEHRKEHGIPKRCDNEACQFHTQPLVWLEKPLEPILR
jgi:hypothetical protein